MHKVGLYQWCAMPQKDKQARSRDGRREPAVGPPPTLPPLAAIRAFEAAARHRSFTRAAEELAMTQAAISYQIRVLEDRIGAPLFVRRPRGVELTSEGARLADRAGEALDLLREAFAEARKSTDETLVISVLASFATQVLAPRLGAFQIAHPSVTTRVEVDTRIVDLAAGDATVAIRVGSGPWPGTRADFLMRPAYTPLVSPAFVARHGLPATPADLVGLPLVDAADVGWRGWFERAGVVAPPTRPGGHVSMGMQTLVVQAALAGQGAALVDPVFFGGLIRRGDLIRPFAVEWPDPWSLWFCVAERRRNAPAVRAFRDWLIAEVAALLQEEGAGDRRIP